MRRLLALTLLLPLLASAQTAAAPAPPVAPKHPFVVSSPFGDRVDEYHWLRDDDPKAKRPEVMQDIEAENAYAAAMLAPLQPLQDRLLAEMLGRVDQDDSTAPVYDHGWWRWRHFEPGAEYPLLMRRRGTPERPDPGAPDEVLLDEPRLAAGHAYFAVAATAVSPDGQWLAWSQDTTGRRIYTLHIRNLKTGQVLDERIEGVMDELVWANDNRTLFYLRQNPTTLQADAVMRHRRGVAADTLVYREADTTLSTAISASASRQYLVIALEGYATNEIRVLGLNAPGRAPRVLLARRPGLRPQADHLDGRWVVRTNEGAPDFRLVQARVPRQRDTWKDLVPARAGATVEAFALLHGRVAVQERVQGRTQVRLLGAGGATIASDAATTTTLGDNRDPAAADLRYDVTSLVQPQATWDRHLKTGRAVLRRERPVPGYDPSLYATARVWAPSRDGQRIPVTLAWRRDRAQRDGRAPLYIEGYGAYGLSFDAEFSSSRISLLDHGFVYAIAHVRGGAELGQSWYEAGRLLHKKNSFNDFVDVTRFLVAEGWGDAARVFASGGSAGGLLMGVVANEAGSLYKGIALNVPFVDVVTTMLDETIPLTANEWTQWGDPRRQPDHDYMLSYSPYDNIGARDYPAMLVTSGLWDSQVQYYEPAKFVARLRAKKTDHHPLLFVTNLEAGHGGASGRFEQLKEVAREYAFFIDLAQPPSR